LSRAFNLSAPDGGRGAAVPRGILVDQRCMDGPRDGRDRRAAVSPPPKSRGSRALLASTTCGRRLRLTRRPREFASSSWLLSRGRPCR
jgi:hypothetical protein